MAGLRDVVFDADHALNLAQFWDTVLDTHTLPPFDDDDLAWMAERGMDPNNPTSISLNPVDEDNGLRIWFNRVPDPTPGKNRLHIDVNLRSEDELQRLLDLGATVVSPPEKHGERWWILADPEGNQFCAFPPD